jgi:hypothetical protein
MPLSPNEIKNRALRFAREWKDATGERAEAQTFWNELFHVFGIERKRVGTFEKRVSRLEQAMDRSGAATGGGFIDLFWPGVLIAEHKSRGKDLDSAFQQALDYTDYLKKREMPRYVIVSDFARIRLHDLEEGQEHVVALEDLHDNIDLFGFIAGYSSTRIREQDPVNIQAAERMAKLYDKLVESGYPEHDLKVLLVRLLFCLFAEDTALFEPRGAFQEYLENNTSEDGSDLGHTINWIFEILNVPIEQRQKNLDERIGGLPYVNGRLFEERLRTPAFNAEGRELLLECCGLDWGRISPAVFGSLFQSVMDKEARRQLGAHYTSEENILKLLKPLYLDDLRAEFEKVKRSRNKLFELHKKLGSLRFMDPACGCGNFLVIAYRELRLLELDILRAALKIERASGQRLLNVFHLIQVNVDQFYGIEIEEFPAQIAQVAMWLVDHQMNLIASEEFGQYYYRLPLTVSPTVVCGNALEMDWQDVVPAEKIDYILGNPPFGGAKYQSAEQRGEMARIFDGVRSFGLLDYVSAWYLRAVQYLRGEANGQGTLDALWPGKPPRDRVKVAFVSTNSITQGEQVSVLWNELLRLGVKIHFAHRTFQWQSEARGKAAVHCVIIGFALFDTDDKRIYDYPDIRADPIEAKAGNINPYLVDAPDVIVGRRRSPICDVPQLNFGSMPNDDGNLLLSEDEHDFLLQHEPDSAKWIRPFLSAREYLNNTQRWCLWLQDISPQELRALKHVGERVENVRNYRQASSRAATRKLADFPALFGEIRQPVQNYIAIPKTSSERRPYIPVSILPPDVIAGSEIFTIQSSDSCLFGILSSAMHMSWMRYVAGRLKSDYRYSGGIVYNNFPWPQRPSEAQTKRIEEAAQGVLDARGEFPEASLADLYDAVAMPPALRKAHAELDKAVDAAYGRRTYKKEADRVAFLFDLYARYTEAV